MHGANRLVASVDQGKWNALKHKQVAIHNYLLIDFHIYIYLGLSLESRIAGIVEE